MKEDIEDFRLIRNLTKGEVDFNQVLRLRNQPNIAVQGTRRNKKLVSGTDL